MTPEAFLALSTAEQLLAIYERLEPKPAPANGGTGDGRAPKYDLALHRGQGKVSYASECSLRELQYHLRRAEQPPSDPKYQESNDRRAKALRYFIAYRQSCPDEHWRGERNRTTVTAAAPSDKPLLYDKDAPTHVEPPVTTGDAAHEDGDIPF